MQLHSPGRLSPCFYMGMLCIAVACRVLLELLIFSTKTPLVPMMVVGLGFWFGFSPNWEVHTETPFSVMTRSGFTFRMSSQTRRISSSEGVGF